MIQSMTGYGRGVSRSDAGQVTAEMKAVNHRYCELQSRCPRRFAPLEERLRSYLTEALGRGKIDLYIKTEQGEESGADLHINKALARRYREEIRNLAEELDLAMDFGVSGLIAIPGVLSTEEREEAPEELWLVLREAVDGALAQLTDMRKAEGERLALDFSARLDGLETLRAELLAHSDTVVEHYRQRLTARIGELMGQQPVDENRLVQEVAMFADRACIDEELVRLDSHFRQFRALLASDEPVGRKLDFLCQEIHREVNTVGSKANDSAMTKIVVEMKSEVEKLREQVQNVR